MSARQNRLPAELPTSHRQNALDLQIPAAARMQQRHLAVRIGQVRVRRRILRVDIRASVDQNARRLHVIAVRREQQRRAALPVARIDAHATPRERADLARIAAIGRTASGETAIAHRRTPC
ncbi:hypothetical protein [Burkholderia territorii]|uniref:hypothetical protein n=1 Tax=Burkholderia territorii TaxID=1503055 RepID=UPI0018C88FE9